MRHKPSANTSGQAGASKSSNNNTRGARPKSPVSFQGVGLGLGHTTGAPQQQRPSVPSMLRRPSLVRAGDGASSRGGDTFGARGGVLTLDADKSAHNASSRGDSGAEDDGLSGNNVGARGDGRKVETGGGVGGQRPSSTAAKER